MKCSEWLFRSRSPLVRNYPCPSLLHPNSITYWFPSLQKCSARSEKPLKSSAVSTVSWPLFSPAHSQLFLFLVSLFLQSFSSMRFSLLCQSCMPITTKPTCAEQVILFSGEVRRERKGGGGGHRGAYWGRAKYTICNWSYAVGFCLTWMLKSWGR